MTADSQTLPQDDPTPTDPGSLASDLPPAAEAAQDSAAFLRCVSCRYAVDIRRASGTLVCLKHEMRCDAESDAIPDNCIQFEPLESDASNRDA